MTTDVMTIEQGPAPLTKSELLSQVRVIQDVMGSVMKKDEHFGTVPGCGNKPTLLKPGAEKLMHAFHLAADPDVLPMFVGDDDKVGYRVTCRLNSIHTGRFIGAGVGECSSEETKYKWRKAVCDQEFQQADEERRQEKFGSDGKTTKQVRTNPHDLSNTILKMAKKRALVDAVLTALAASDIFTQDVEEAGQHPIGEAQPNPSPTGLPSEHTWHVGLLVKFEVKEGTTGKKPWKRHICTFELENGSTFEIGCLHLPEGWDEEILNQYQQSNDLLMFQWFLNHRKYKELSALAPHQPEQEMSA